MIDQAQQNFNRIANAIFAVVCGSTIGGIIAFVDGGTVLTALGASAWTAMVMDGMSERLWRG